MTLTRPFLVTKITLSPKWPYHENVIPWCMLPYLLQIITFLLLPFRLYLFQLFYFSSQTSSTILNRYIESQKQPRLVSDFSGTVLRTGLSQWPKNNFRRMFGTLKDKMKNSLREEKKKTKKLAEINKSLKENQEKPIKQMKEMIRDLKSKIGTIKKTQT